MLRSTTLVALMLMVLIGPVAAQPPLLELSQQVVEAGATISVTVTGPPFHFFGVASSSSNSGLVPGLELGPDITIIGFGQLDADGRAVFPFAVPTSPSPLYVQGATSPDPGFSVFTPTPAKTITEGGQTFTGQITVGPGVGSGFTSVMGLGSPSSQRNAQTLMPRNCEVSGLRARATPSLHATQEIVLALTVNGGDVLICTLNAFSPNACNSGVGSYSAVQGDLIAMRFSYSIPEETAVAFGFLCN